MFRRKGPSEVEIAKENDIKIAITQEFSKALKTVQKEGIGTEDHAVYSTDTANSVCNCLEAVFLHGLKAKAITKIASYVGVGSSATAQTTLNFWNFVAKFTHSEVLSQLKHLGQITTEVGLCRAWVRVALNDGIMESYIDAMVADTKTLQNYYNSMAYLRDREQPEIMKTYLQGLMHFQFKLSYNASVLNDWAYTPLLLAGVIDSNDAPPPIIKPAVTNTKRKSVVSTANIPTIDTTETTVEVEQMRSRSRGNSDAKANIHYNSQNSMDQPPYIVSSSEFTSQDVEEIKKMSSRKSAKAMSECSSSSHLSCPDPPHMNASPATYVKRMYGGRDVSPLSDRSFKGLDSEKGLDGPEERVVGEARQSEKLEAGVQRISESSAVTVDSSGYGADVENEETVNEEWDVLEKGKYEAGESPGQHGQSPVEKPVEDLKRRYQRLESFNRELQEKAIVDGYIEPDAGSKKNDWAVYGNDHMDDIDGDLTIRAMGKVISSKSGEKEQDVLQGNQAANLTGVTEDLLNISQKILNELGLEDTKKSIHIEQEVTKNDFQPKETVSTPKKTKKPKQKEEKMDKLKPKLSLSPPNPEIVPPVLSNAVADKVERLQTLENPDYLSKHRHSLPAIGVMQRKSEKRKSMPNVMEDVNEEGQTSIEEYLYGTTAFDELEPKKDNEVEGDLRQTGADKSEDDIDSDEDRTLRSRFKADPRPSIGNNLMLSARGWSSSFESEFGDTVDAMSPSRASRALPVNRPKSESFGTLLQNYTPGSSLTRHSIDDVLATLPKRTNTIISPATSPNEDGEGLEGFEVVTNEADLLESNEVSKIRLFSEIANEKGLDAQNFQCRGCKRPLGLIFGKQRVCKFDGGYYCFECHENDEYYIPAIIVHNWDFRKHQVAKRNLEFLQDKEEQPYINVDETNPRIYEHVSEMAEIQGLRRQLMYLKMYLFTCKQSIAEDFRRIIWPRDYLYESIELYSLADLLQVPTGGLAGSLRKLIRFASKHVYSCRLCSQKGFICELCNNPKVIYAFELDATIRCSVCKTVFHKECKTDNRACPKCQRRLHRQSMQGSSSQILTPDYDLHVT